MAQESVSSQREKEVFYSHVFVSNVYGELHRNHCCMNGSIMLKTGPEKSRVETSPGYSVSEQTILFATQCPLEVSVLFVNRHSMLRILCKRWAPRPPLIASP